MKTKKSLKMAARMVVHSKLRSWLTIIGIVIGVASVIAIIAISDGMSASLNAQFSDLGSDTLTLTPGHSKGSPTFGPGRMKKHPDNDDSSSSDDPTLGRVDVMTLKLIPEIEYIDTIISGNAEVYYGGESGSIRVTGVDQQFWKFMTTDKIGAGRLLDAADSNVVVIGERLATEYFKKEIGINKILTIEGNTFRVVGILEKGTGNSIYMPIVSAYNILDKEVGKYDKIEIKLKEGIDTAEDVEAVIEKIEMKLKISRHVTDNNQDFTVTSPLQMVENVNEMTGTMSMFLIGIAAISLLVGAVGIANTMFTSVLERRKEIGIMKAIGARNKDILTVFLLNAGLLGLTGGLIGVIVGYIASIAISMVLGVATIVSIQVVAIALLVSMIVGMISGLVPAYNGSKLNPVDALRSE